MKRRCLLLTAVLGLLLAAPAWAAPGFLEHSVATFDEAVSVYATDVDGDGDVDVLGTSDYQGIRWWENDGSENFAEHTIGYGWHQSVYATDVDSDGDVDVLGSRGAAVRWWENDGSENLTGHTVGGVGGSTWCVYATDVDGDGDVDVLAAAHDFIHTPHVGSITWWENDPSGDLPPGDPITWTEHILSSNFDGAKYVHATDVEPDGDVDVLGAGGAGIRWWENDGSENFTEHTITDKGDPAHATDLDRDGDVDVVGGGRWWENDGSENFAEHAITCSLGYCFWTSCVYATDLDGDGDVDLLGSVGTGDWNTVIGWCSNDGSENFTQHTITGCALDATSVYATDVDGDGDVDILSAEWGNEFWDPGRGIKGRIKWWENLQPQIYVPFVPLALVPKNYD